jgi:hypothetical protein
VRAFRFWCVSTALFLVTLPNIGLACSPARISLYEQFNKHSKVFLGTVGQRIKDAAPGLGIYRIVVDEGFKGLADAGKSAGVLDVTLSETEQCGLGRPEKNDRILIFMNEGDVVNVTSRSRLIWREAEQQEARLNPTMDDLVTLRRMLFPNNQAGIVPDEDTALHQGLKVLVAVFGLAEVTMRMPYKVTYLAEQPGVDERVWRIEGAHDCRNGKPEHCGPGRYGADVNRWTGDVVRVFSGD